MYTDARKMLSNSSFHFVKVPMKRNVFERSIKIKKNISSLTTKFVTFYKIDERIRCHSCTDVFFRSSPKREHCCSVENRCSTYTKNIKVMWCNIPLRQLYIVMKLSSLHDFRNLLPALLIFISALNLPLKRCDPMITVLIS